MSVPIVPPGHSFGSAHGRIKAKGKEVTAEGAPGQAVQQFGAAHGAMQSFGAAGGGEGRGTRLNTTA